jgi:ATP-binding cassette, subfamily C (CFTR/MRP), member 1
MQPAGALSNKNIVAALHKTRLWSHFKPDHTSHTVINAHRILNSPMASLPRMSGGQSQLFALARATIKLQAINQSNIAPLAHPGQRRIMPIILLDEVTSSLDVETESTVRNIIQEEFTAKGHTVIAITHRLNGIVENIRPGQDLVALLSRGELEKIGEVEDVLGIVMP